MKPIRGYGALRRHRVSLPNARYFLTLCTRERKVGLTPDDLATDVNGEIVALERDGHWRLSCAVIMPDHIHVLARLTESTTLDRIGARTREVLGATDIRWQGNFYEHRLRPDDPTEPVLRYLHLNPYRANLLAVHEHWRWFWLGEEERHWFEPMLDDGRPFPEWLRE
ncbi:MAG TPA: hypothetical protein VM029_14460 [Opitutaceae bacterium]|nr:hypothetical protein [Opitutaceae bacterium]